MGSPTLQFITSRGWNWKSSTSPNIELETCPYCNKSGYGHCYVEVHGSSSENKKRDGLHACHKCGKSGNLNSLKQHLGVEIAGVESRRDWGGAERKVEDLPDTEALHEALLNDDDALDYLMNFRGFSLDIIKRQKIGLTKRYFKECGEVRALSYPYLVNGNTVFAHYRTLPTVPVSENKVPKAFSSPKGWNAPLYNGHVIRDGITELVLVEGEPNTIAALDKGIEDICGVPGANFKKADWIDTLDKVAPEKIYIAYDKDKVGQKAAQTLAARIGIEKCWKIKLPDFEVTTDEGEVRPGKDLNEWFTVGGGTAEAFAALKEEAEQFDVDGVSSSKDAVEEFLEQLQGKGGVEPKYKTQWDGINRILGFEDGDVIDILAPEKIGKTTFGLNLIEHMVDTYGDDGIIICLEMTRARLARKWIAHKAQIADNVPKTPEEAQSLTAEFLGAIPQVQQMAANREGELYFCYPRYEKMEDLYTLIRDVIRRYGVKWIMFDNVQRACDVTIGGKGRTQHLSEISKVLSQIAKDYGVQMIRILQPHRIGDGRMVTTDNVDGASQIMKDNDCAITLHRNRVGQLSAEQFESCGYVEQEQAFDDKMLATVGLSRYSSGGYVTLLYDGARSTVTNFDPLQVAAIHAEANKNVGYEAQMQSLGIKPKTQPEGAPVKAEDGAISF